MEYLDMSDEKEMAFPLEMQFIPKHNVAGALIKGSNGMTLRDYMAGQALAGFAGYSGDRADVLSANPNLVAKTAYVWADAMLKARRND